MGRKVKIGVIGMGVGQWHIASINALRDAELVAICDIKPRIVDWSNQKEVSLDEYAGRLGVPAYNDGVKMMDEIGMDAVILAIGPKFRLPFVKAAADRGIAIFYEKPLGNTAKETIPIKKLIDDAGIIVNVDFVLAYMEPVIMFKKLMDEGKTGEINIINADLQFPWEPPKGDWHWDVNDGNGLINDDCCHIIAPIYLLAGEPEEVFAYGGNYSGNGETEDAAAILIKFRSGAVCSITNGGRGSINAGDAPIWLNVCAQNAQAVIYGRDHMFKKADVKIKGEGDPSEVVKLEWKQPERKLIMKNALEEFVKCVQEGRKPMTGFDFGIRVQEIIDAILLSIRTGKAVKL